jgi:hypothetical protein
MPHLGIVMVKNNILCIRFNDEIVNIIRLNPNKLHITKKHVNLNSKVYSNNGATSILTDLPEVERNVKKFRPQRYWFIYLVLLFVILTVLLVQGTQSKKKLITSG